MSRDNALFLEDILDSIDKIEDYTNDLTEEEFQDDDKTIDAVVRNFKIIGEAANNIPEDLKERYPRVPSTYSLSTSTGGYCIMILNPTSQILNPK